MLNKKGFTLVELLVTIVIMLTILALAIVSYVNISDRKKTEAFESIKTQAEAAAEQYFQSNSYFLKELDDDNVAYVSIGRLVKMDYLNKVVNPLTGKVLDECSYVKVEKKNYGYVYTFVEEPRDKEEDGTCDNNNFTVVQDKSPSAPTAKIEFYSLKNGLEKKIEDYSNYWLNIEHLGENGILRVKVIPTSESPITSVTYKTTNGTTTEAEKNNNYYQFDVDDDGVESNVPITVTNSSGKVYKEEIAWKKDTVAPTGTISLKSTASNYSSNVVNISFNLKDGDGGSGIEKLDFNAKDDWELQNGTTDSVKTLSISNYSLNDEMDGSSYAVSAEIYDVAGNKGVTNSQSYVLYEDCTTNVKVTNVIGPKWSSCVDGLKIYLDVKVTDDTVTGNRCETYADGLTATCETTPPDCPSLTTSRLPGDTGKNGWYNKGIRFNITPAKNTSKWVFKTDNGSGGYTTWKTHTGTASNSDHTLTGNGAERMVQIEVYNSSGAKRTCNYGPYKIDTTPPTIKYNYYTASACPGDPSPSSRPGVQASFVVTDNLSGLNSNSVKYYYDGKSSWTNQSIYISGKISGTQMSFSKTSTYSNYGNCKVGSSVSKNICYYNHIRATDVAGNVTTVNSSSCKYPGP